MKNRKHIGSSFDSFLEQEGLLEEISVTEVYKEKCKEAISILDELKITEKDILDYVARRKDEPMIHSKIAEDLGLSYSTVVRALSKLQKLNVIDKVLRDKKIYYITNLAFSRKIYFALRNELYK